MSLDQKLWSQAYSGYNVGFDFYGLNRDTNTSTLLHKRGFLHPNTFLSAMPEGTGVSAVTEDIGSFARYASNDYGIGIVTTNPARMYLNNAGTWTFQTGLTVSATGSTSQLNVYGGHIYYPQKSVLGRYDGTSSQANFQTFSGSAANPRPSAVFSGSIYFGDDNLVAKWDGTTFNAAALTLPSNFVITSLEVYTDRLFISASDGATAKLFIWDGVSTTFEQSVSFDEPNAPSLVASDGYLWIVSNNTQFKFSPIYIYNGSSLTKILDLPIKRGVLSGVAKLRNGILIGANETSSSATYEDGSAGIWYIGRSDDQTPYMASLLFKARNLTSITMSAVASLANALYAGVRDIADSSYWIFGETNTATNGNYIWQTQLIDGGSNDKKQWHGVRIEYNDLTSGDTIVIKYRLDDDTSFTTLVTIVSTTTQDIYFPLGATSRQITLRIEENTSSTGGSSIQGLTLDYSPLKD